MKKIPLRNRKKEIIAHALIDDECYEWISQWRWCRSSKGYARRNRKKTDGRGPKNIRMHRIIAGTPEGMETDHINGNRLDNRKSNLRICSHAENVRGRNIQINSSSGFKGVSWYKVIKKWRARIMVDKRRIHLGYFKDPVFAASAYNEAALKYHGEFAKLNE